MTRLYIMKVPEQVEAERMERLLRLTSADKREKLKRLRRTEDQNRTLFADLLARCLIAEEFNLSNEKIAFAAGPFGKPFALGLDDLKFNLSHAGSWVACAIDRQEVGVDIEQIAPIELEIARRFFAPEECGWLLQAEPAERLNRFYELWTIKESFIKMTGCGLNTPLDSFRVCKEQESFAIYEGKHKLSCRARSYEAEQGYKLAVCAAEGRLPDAPLLFSQEEIETRLR